MSKTSRSGFLIGFSKLGSLNAKGYIDLLECEEHRFSRSLESSLRMLTTVPHVHSGAQKTKMRKVYTLTRHGMTNHFKIKDVKQSLRDAQN